MFTSLSALSLILAASSAVASPFSQDKSSLVQRENDTAGKSHSTTPNVVRSTWDGKCFYPTADETFHLEEYLGKWYQVAGTVAEFTAGCSCITAEYSLNSNGTVRVSNKCQIQDRQIDIVGEAVPADPAYGSKGVLNVQFATSSPNECPGPNYIVQDYTGDFAIVQASNFSTLFVLSRERNIGDNVIEAWIKRAGKLGSDLSNVVKTDQTGCQ